jgi:hypothetical protein
MKRYITLLLLLVISTTPLFSLSIMAELQNDYFSRFDANQKIDIMGYAILLDETANSMDEFTWQEQYELMALISWNDFDAKEVMLELQGAVDIGNNDPVSIIVRADIIEKFKVTMDLDDISGMIKDIGSKGIPSAEKHSILVNLISNFVSGVNPKSEYGQFMISLDEMKVLINRLSFSDNILQSIQYSLQDQAIRTYIIKGHQKSSTRVDSAVASTVAEQLAGELNADFGSSFDTASLARIITALMKNGRDKNRAFSEAYSLIADFCQGGDKRSKFARIQVPVTEFTKIIEKLSFSKKLGRTLLITLNDPDIKQYIVYK